MKSYLLVGFGSFLGGIFRYGLSNFILTRFPSAFPFGTLSVNLLGCFAIGFILGILSKANNGREWQLFLATGVCGGFTTFSSFSNETYALFQDGLWTSALLYAAISLLIGVLATIAGYALARIFTS
ncbi:MAG: fluoride efflux transporter CrcB [Chloroherpetonaceae bacterium]|nr:fluoride efflux transporter CrcB [Chloroherpetonaceae bacterium]